MSEWKIPVRTETTEDRLNRMFAGWTDTEVESLMVSLRESQDRHRLPWSDIWREYAKRTFSDNAVCKRCGSDNHTAENHPE